MDAVTWFCASQEWTINSSQSRPQADQHSTQEYIREEQTFGICKHKLDYVKKFMDLGGTT